MVEEEPDPPLIDEDAVEERSLLADIGTLIDDGRTLVEAEIAYQKTRAGYAARQAIYLAIGVGCIAVLLVLALMALVLGIVLALAPALTPWGAGFAVAGVLGLAALLGLAMAVGAWRNLGKAFGGNEE